MNRQELTALYKEAKKELKFRSECYKSNMEEARGKYKGTDYETKDDRERMAELTEEYEKEKLRHIAYIAYRKNELKTYLHDLSNLRYIKKEQQKRAKHLNKLKQINEINIF